MLGTNDAHTYQTSEGFAADYADLVSDYQSLDNEPQVLLVIPPPIYENNLELSGTNLKNSVIPRIEQVAEELNLPIVDVNSALENHPEYFIDGIHPNSDGALVIASEINDAINFEIAQNAYSP
jgi:lysophospholipase L1-like esterase